MFIFGSVPFCLILFAAPCAALNCYMMTISNAQVTHQHTDPSSCGLPLSRVDIGSASTTVNNTRLPRNRVLQDAGRFG